MSGLKITLISLKNNLEIRNQILNLTNDETPERLKLYSDIFSIQPKLKENLIMKLIKNFAELMKRIKEITTVIQMDLGKISDQLNKKEVIDIIKIMFEKDIYQNNENCELEILENNCCELLKIDEELIKFNKM